MGFFTAGDVGIETMYGNPLPGGEDPTIQRRLTQMIDDAPVGATIHASIFRLNLDYVRDALVAADNRGTPVHVIHDGQDQGSEIGVALAQDTPTGLGSRHRWSGKLYDPTGTVYDYGAIATGRNSDLHTKLFLFSATRDPNGLMRPNVSWWGSPNMSRRSGTQKSNNAIAVYDDKVLYDNFRTRLWDLLWDQVHVPDNDFYNGNVGRGTFMGRPATRCKVFCSPEQTTDLWVNRLASVVVEPDTEVDVAQVRFFDSRAVVADQLVRIKEAGGAVRVAVGSEPAFLGPVVRSRLLDAGIPVRTANIHDKLVLVHSRYALSTGRRKVVLSGSHNLTYDGNYINDDLLVKMFNDEVYDDMLAAHFDRIWATGVPVDPLPPVQAPDDGTAR